MSKPHNWKLRASFLQWIEGFCFSKIVSAESLFLMQVNFTWEMEVFNLNIFSKHIYMNKEGKLQIY